MSARQRGFTLIELLIVVAIIGIIAAMVVPSLLLMIQRAKQKRAMAEMRGIGTAIATYATDTNRAPIPTGGTGWQDSVTAIPYGDLAPMYIKEVPNPDPWNVDYQYTANSSGSNFGVRTLGMDSAADSPDLDTLLSSTVVETVCLENDIVWVNSDFQIWPQGKQVRCY